VLYWQEWMSQHTSWLAKMKNDLSYHNLSVEDATVLALDRPLWEVIGSKWSYALKWCKLINDSTFHIRLLCLAADAGYIDTMIS